MTGRVLTGRVLTGSDGRTVGGEPTEPPVGGRTGRAPSAGRRPIAPRTGRRGRTAARPTVRPRSPAVAGRWPTGGRTGGAASPPLPTARRPAQPDSRWRLRRRRPGPVRRTAPRASTAWRRSPAAPAAGPGGPGPDLARRWSAGRSPAPQQGPGGAHSDHRTSDQDAGGAQRGVVLGDAHRDVQSVVQPRLHHDPVGVEDLHCPGAVSYTH